MQVWLLLGGLGLAVLIAVIVLAVRYGRSDERADQAEGERDACDDLVGKLTAADPSPAEMARRARADLERRRRLRDS